MGITVIPQPALERLLVIACELVDHLDADPAPLSQMLGVTPAEGRTAVALASGHSLAAIAERDGLSIHTVRYHVKHVLAKTGVNSQAQLVRLVVKLSQIAAVPAAWR